MNEKKKYYMRGLGFGILITAIVLGIVHYNDRMTDEKVVKRARELGYVLNENAGAAPSQSIDMEALKAKLTGTPQAEETPDPDDPKLIPIPE